ncbi:MAG: HEPN domain-containing protein [Candidatus Ratteibacteria bacterium]
MKKSKEESERWLKQAEYDLKSAKINFDSENYAYTCFMCEQSAQKSLKAYLFFKEERYVWEHSIKKLAQKCQKFDKDFERVEDMGIILDKYYLITRYPDALPPPAVPYESFTKKEAEESIRIATEIINLVKSKIGYGK